MQTENMEQDPLQPLGILRFEPEIPAVIGKVLPNGVAATAGLLPGDRLLEASGQRLESWQDWVALVRKNPGRLLDITVERRGLNIPVSMTPAPAQEHGQTVGKIGAAPEVDEKLFAGLMTEVRYGPVDALLQGAIKTWDMSEFTLEMMGRMVLGQVSMKNLSGPLTIAEYAGQSAALGWLSFAGFLALVSVSLGVLNLLPIPLLDGGHLLYYIFEIFTGRPVPERVMELGSRVGFGLLMLLTAFALYNDLQRLTSG
jgi:regulator of sigma E protease